MKENVARILHRVIGGFEESAYRHAASTAFDCDVADDVEAPDLWSRHAATLQAGELGIREHVLSTAALSGTRCANSRRLHRAKFRGSLSPMEVIIVKKKSRVEILRGKLRRMGESDAIHPAMPDEVAESFIAELRLDPDVGAIAARDWSPENRNEEAWIKDFFASQPRLRTTEQAAQYVEACAKSRGPFGEEDDEAVN